MFLQDDDTRGTVVHGRGQFSEFLLCSLSPDNIRTLTAECQVRPTIFARGRFDYEIWVFTVSPGVPVG